jgi:hypothetical protein
MSGGSFFELKPIRPRAIDVKQVQGKLLGVLQAYGYKYLNELYSAVFDWEHGRPRFRIERHYRGGDVSIRVWTEDLVFNSLNNGTTVRWAVMNSPFEPMTRPGRMRSTPGQHTYNKYGYYTAIRGKRAMSRPTKIEEGTGRMEFKLIDFAYSHPIQARNWYLQLRLKYGQNFQRDVQRAVREGLRMRVKG